MRCRLLSLALLIGCFAFAQEVRQASYQDLMQEGEKYRAAQDFADALTSYRKAAGRALMPAEAGRAKYRVGQMLEKLGDLDGALRSYNDSSKNLSHPDIDAAIERVKKELSESVVKASIIISALHDASTRSQSVEPSVDLYVNFDTDSDELTETGVKQVAELAQALSDPDFQADRFEIDGHTDKRGSDEHNLALSARRAGRVRDALINQFKLQASRFDVKGLGKTRPIRPGTSDEDNRINRRVEVKLLRRE
jgi:outer membrane protein OmpA-like peptidoglycan-associated protein